MSFLAMSLGDWFCVSRNVRVGQGEVGWYNQRMKTEWPCLGLAVKIHQNRHNVTTVYSLNSGEVHQEAGPDVI